MKTLLFLALLEVVTSERSLFGDIPTSPEDPIDKITAEFKKDPNKNKLNLGVGAYRGADGKPYILPSVREAERRLFVSNLDHEYSDTVGNENFTRVAAELLYGKYFSAIQERKLVVVQTLASKGALRLGFNFLKKFYPGVKKIYTSDPTYTGYKSIAAEAKLDLSFYRYYDNKTKGLDYRGMLQDIQDMPNMSIILLQASGHNPTGIDLTQDQWRELAVIVKQKQLYPFLDVAYAGLTPDGFEKDVFPVRYFAPEVGQICVAQSFSKIFGLYGERVGTFSILSQSEDEAARILSQLKTIILGSYDNPPIHGARLVNKVLSSPDLRARWVREHNGMADRLLYVRFLLKTKLQIIGSEKKFKNIMEGKGFYFYSGLTPNQIEKITKEYSIHILENGRINLSALTESNVTYLANALHAVTKFDEESCNTEMVIS